MCFAKAISGKQKFGSPQFQALDIPVISMQNKIDYSV